MSFLPVFKRVYPVHCSCPARGTVVHNYLEGADYVTDDDNPFVITGTRQEQWTISRDHLLKTYQLTESEVESIGPTPRLIFTREGRPVRYWANLVPSEVGPFEVRTKGGYVLVGNRLGVRHGWGDFIIASDDNGKPSETDRWVVNGLVFFDTYQLLEDGLCALKEEVKKGD